MARNSGRNSTQPLLISIYNNTLYKAPWTDIYKIMVYIIQKSIADIKEYYCTKLWHPKTETSRVTTIRWTRPIFKKYWHDSQRTPSVLQLGSKIIPYQRYFTGDCWCQPKFPQFRLSQFTVFMTSNHPNSNAFLICEW